MNKKLSVIIPLYNAEKYIEECIASIIKAEPYDKEIIVVNNNSTDKSAEKASSFKEVRFFNETKVGPCAARNKGIKESTGEILIFLDNDLIVDKNCLLEIINTFNENEKIVCVGGAGHSYDRDNLISMSHEVRLMGYAPNKKGIFEVRTVPTMAFGILRKALDEVGYFDEHLMGAEDYDLCLRLKNKGFKCVINTNAKVYHHHPTTIKDLSNKWFKYGIMWVIANKKHKIYSELLKTVLWLLLFIISTALIVINYKFIILSFFIFILPWLIFYSVDTLKFVIKWKKISLLLFPLVHQTVIVSRSLGILYAVMKSMR